MSASDSSQPGMIPLEVLQTVAPDWTTDALLAHAGPPWQVHPADARAGPTAVFESLGFCSLKFDLDSDLDEVWEYRHDRRAKLKLANLLVSLVGVRDGYVTGIWRVQYDQPAEGG